MPYYFQIHKSGVFWGIYLDACLTGTLQDSELKKIPPLSNIYGLLKADIPGKNAAFLFTYFPG